MQVRELQDGSQVQAALIVRAVDVRRRREGDEFLMLKLGDRSGNVAAVALQDVDQARETCVMGEIVHVTGTFTVHPRYGGRVVVDAVRAATDEDYDPAELFDGPAHPFAQMEADLRELIATVQNPHLRGLLDELLGDDSPTWARFREAPAAKYYHQAYRHGLLEHSLTVAQSVSAISATFGGINRDVAVTGALLHDIGKLDAYEVVGEAIEMSDQGRLYGEIPLGYYMVRSTIESLQGFPPGDAQAVLHIILSHHGSLEHGSPVIPCTREATLVHMADNLGGKLGSFDRVQKSLPTGAQWSAFDKAIGGGAFFAAPGDEARAAA